VAPLDFVDREQANRQLIEVKTVFTHAHLHPFDVEDVLHHVQCFFVHLSLVKF